jgi:toxin-antitoxin system PIN domain toxin
VSFLVDTNVFIHAGNTRSPYHGPSKALLERCAADASDTWYISWINVFEYLRLATHPGVQKPPLPADTALGNVRTLLSLPQVRVLIEEEDFLDDYETMLSATGPVSGNLVHDARIAALMKKHGVKKIFTYDLHFRIFPFLDVSSPG